jgi:diguanylate cyclase (GGDEF)-like protein
MLLDIHTLSIVTVFVTAILGALLVFAGLQNSGVRAPTWWGAAFIIGSFGLGLISLRGTIPNWVSINAANALVLFSYSLLWAGARDFDGRRPLLVAMVAAPALWLIASATSPLVGNINLRVALMSALIATLSAFAAAEFWRGRAEPLMSRWPTICVLLVNVAAMAARIPVTLLSPLQGQSWINGTAFVLLSFATLLFTVVLAFLLLNMTKERTELQHKVASLIDPLTGVPNRRAFIKGANRRLARRGGAGARLAILLFDLDHFKKVNDQLGHGAGDSVLQLFAAAATATLGPGVLFGRIGGEEFAAVTAVDDLDEAVAMAERVRARFAAVAADHVTDDLMPSVSVGVTLAGDAQTTVTDLLAAADQALYRAKANGRNRVEFSEWSPSIVSLVPDVAALAGEPGAKRSWRKVSARA